MDETPLSGPGRFEVKFAGHTSSIGILEAWLRTHRAGFREAFPPRIVNSSYFDTYALDAYAENLLGGSERAKVRLRWYGREPETDRATLEVKLRKNKLGWKLSYPITGVPRRDATWRDLQSRVRAQLPDDARVRFDAHPLVALVNTYRRRYLQSGDGRVRVTLDTELLAFDQRFGRKPSLGRSIQMPLGLVVEFKFGPENRRIAMDSMVGIPLRVSRSSKYAIGCSLLAAT